MSMLFQPIVFAVTYIGGDPNITIEATKYSTKGKPTSWAIRHTGFCLSKKTLEFTYEPRPSNRSDEWIAEHRYKTLKQAEKTAIKFINKKGLQRSEKVTA